MTFDAPSVSVIVASHGRPDWLLRCLTGLGQLDYPNFEVVIAADNGGVTAAKTHPLSKFCKFVRCETPNISKTRNAGVGLAAGDLVAFIDDDAVPEPTWLTHLVAALEKTGADAAAGYVRGRDGIAFQSCAETITPDGESHHLAHAQEEPSVPEVILGHALKLVGTNFAIRRSVLCELGGFDPAYRYYLDDSDLSWRFRCTGYVAAIAPQAEVHHGLAPSHRRGWRAPRSLHDIGRSAAIFMRRHIGEVPESPVEPLVQRQRARLVRALQRGDCEPRDVGVLMRSLKEGWDEGAKAPLSGIRPISLAETPFQRVIHPGGGHAIFCARWWDRHRTLQEATRHVQNGGRATVVSLSLTTRRHTVAYLDGGVWFQTGGQFAQSIRRESTKFRWCRFAERCEEEFARVALQRGIGEDWHLTFGGGRADREVYSLPSRRNQAV